MDARQEDMVSSDGRVDSRPFAFGGPTCCAINMGC